MTEDDNDIMIIYTGRLITSLKGSSHDVRPPRRKNRSVLQHQRASKRVQITRQLQTDLPLMLPQFLACDPSSTQYSQALDVSSAQSGEPATAIVCSIAEIAEVARPASGRRDNSPPACQCPEPRADQANARSLPSCMNGRLSLLFRGSPRVAGFSRLFGVSAL